MDDIHLLISRLKDPDKAIRLEACQQLAQVPNLSIDAIRALKQVLYDPDPLVSEAARAGLRAHPQVLAISESPAPSGPVKNVGLIGNLHPAHWLFLIVSMGMLIGTVREGAWGGVFIIFMFMFGCILLIGFTSRSSHQRLTSIWSDLAFQTGLRFIERQTNWIGSSVSPSLSGVYHGRSISISKRVENIPSYEGSIPAVFTHITLNLHNPCGFRFRISPKSFLARLFKPGNFSVGDKSHDQRFQFEGYPEAFLHRVVQWFDNHPVLLEKPYGLTMQTDSPLTAVSWIPPSIYMEGTELSCDQSGVLSDVSLQVCFLDLLCDLAELV